MRAERTGLAVEVARRLRQQKRRRGCSWEMYGPDGEIEECREGSLNIPALSIRRWVPAEAYGSHKRMTAEAAPDAPKRLGAVDEGTAEGDPAPTAPGRIGG